MIVRNHKRIGGRITRPAPIVREDPPPLDDPRISTPGPSRGWIVALALLLSLAAADVWIEGVDLAADLKARGLGVAYEGRTKPDWCG